jgi:hypothetical protein
VTPAQMRQHVLDLATAFNVTLTLDPDRERHFALSNPTARTVEARDITDDTSYAVVLHELGHCCAPSGALPYERTEALRERDFAKIGRLILAEEDAAWEWARHYALDWTLGMEAAYQCSFTSYTQSPARDVGLRSALLTLGCMAEECGDLLVVIRTMSEIFSKDDLNRLHQLLVEEGRR